MWKLALLVSLALAAPVYADCGQPHGSYPEPSGPPEPSAPAPSAPSPAPSGGEEGAGTTQDQLGQTFDPKGGGGMGPSVFDTGGKGGAGLKDEALPKKFPKDSSEWRELKRAEKQVATDRKELDRAKEQAHQAMKDLGNARKEIDNAERKLNSSPGLVNEEGERLISNLKEAVRNEVRAEKNAGAKEQAFSEAINKEGVSRKELNRAWEEATQALRELGEAKGKVESAGIKVESRTAKQFEARRDIGALREAMHNHAKAEAHVEERMGDFDKSINKVADSMDHYEAVKAGMEVQAGQ